MNWPFKRKAKTPLDDSKNWKLLYAFELYDQLGKWKFGMTSPDSYPKGTTDVYDVLVARIISEGGQLSKDRGKWACDKPEERIEYWDVEELLGRYVPKRELGGPKKNSFEQRILTLLGPQTPEGKEVRLTDLVTINRTVHSVLGLGERELIYEQLERPHQKWAIAKMMDHHNEQLGQKQDATIAAGLAARFGKTVSMLEMFRQTNFQVMFVPVHHLASFPSFEKEIGLWDIGEGVEWVEFDYGGHKKCIRKIARALDEGKRVVIGVSLWPGAGGRVRTSRLIPLIRYLERERKDVLVFIDEADLGAHTVRRMEALAPIIDTSVHHTVVLGTGTNISRAAKAHILTRPPVIVSYQDMLEAKEGAGFLFSDLEAMGPLEKAALGEIKSNKSKWVSRMQNIVEPKNVLLTFPQVLLNKIEIESGIIPSWRIVHGSDSHISWIESLMQFLFDPTYASPPKWPYGINIPDIIRKVNKDSGCQEYTKIPVYMIFLGGGATKASASRMQKATERILPDYSCLLLHSGETSNAEAEAVVKEAIVAAEDASKRGVILISIDMGSRSFSVPNIVAVLECYDGGGVHQAHQRHSRALTPDRTGVKKELGIVFTLSFDPNRLTPMEQFLLSNAEAKAKMTGKSLEVEMTRHLPSLLYWTSEGIAPRFKGIDDYIGKLMARKNVAEVMALCTDWSIIESQKALDLIAKINSDIDGKGKDTLAKLAEKATKSGSVSSPATSPKVQEKLIIEQIKTLMKSSGIIGAALGSDAVEEITWEEALDKMSSSPDFITGFKDAVGLTPDEVKTLSEWMPTALLEARLKAGAKGKESRGDGLWN